MNEIKIDNDRVNIIISGWDIFFCLKREVSFYKKNITKVSLYNKSISPPWLKNPGIFIPNDIIAGTYQNLKNRKEFRSTHFNNNKSVIDLQNEQYNLIVLDLPQAESIDEWILKLSPSI